MWPHTRQIKTRARVSTAGISVAAALLLLSGCASSPDGRPIYVPIGGGEDVEEAQPDSSAPAQPGSQSRSQPEEPRAPQPRPQPAPSHRTQGQAISPAAAGLVEQADKAFRAGNVAEGMSLLQRAQRISPDASAVYYKMAEGHVLGGDLARAEQFAAKGVSVAGGNERLQRSGWHLLSDIRRARGNVAGAEDAEERASAL